jgi:hypothetical protein
VSDRKSLADQAVDALAAVARMDADVTNEDDLRYHVRSLKRIAEEHLGNAFRQARDLAWLAEDALKAYRAAALEDKK